MKKIKVGILFGGKSGEHEVSLSSASSVIQGLNKDKYDIVPIYISKDGMWMNPYNSFKVLREKKLLMEGDGRDDFSYSSDESIDLLKLDGQDRSKRVIDVVIPILHGTFGEDGTIQGLLEICNVPYVGAQVMASAIGMDKSMMKTVFKANGLPVCNFITLRRKDWFKDKRGWISQIESEIGFPFVVKELAYSFVNLSLAIAVLTFNCCSSSLIVNGKEIDYWSLSCFKSSFFENPLYSPLKF